MPNVILPGVNIAEEVGGRQKHGSCLLHQPEMAVTHYGPIQEARFGVTKIVQEGLQREYVSWRRHPPIFQVDLIHMIDPAFALTNLCCDPRAPRLTLAPAGGLNSTVPSRPPEFLQ